MLEKIAGVALVTKQRAILLLEADFNCHNKLIFGKRMLDLADEYNIIPDKIYSAKGRTAERTPCSIKSSPMTSLVKSAFHSLSPQSMQLSATIACLMQ